MGRPILRAVQKWGIFKLEIPEFEFSGAIAEGELYLPR